jgi:threonine dehydrogenase-like Zn-dependent dehydrogenase
MIQMKALRFHANIPRYLFTQVAGKISKSAYYRFFPPTKLDDIPEPTLRPGWVKIKTKMAGICGSDINTIMLNESPLLEPLCSFPAVLGHENVGIVTEISSDVKNIKISDRIVLDPILSCKTRGIESICQNCKAGDTVRCENFDRGDLKPAFDIGWCTDTGGAFSSHYLAHETQIHKIPKGISNENATLIEPLTIGIHAVLRHFPKASETVIVIGSGVIGLMVIIALRALGCKSKIIAIDKNVNQGKLALEKGGADSFIQVKKGYYRKVAEEFNARLYKPTLEKKELMVGNGADIIFECVGIPSTIEDSLRFLKSGARMILIGNPHRINVDWSLIWSRELQILGAFGSSVEIERSGSQKHAFKIAIDLISSGKVDLSWMITHKFIFPQEYRKAIKYSMNKEKYGVIKSAFIFD